MCWFHRRRRALGKARMEPSPYGGGRGKQVRCVRDAVKGVVTESAARRRASCVSGLLTRSPRAISGAVGRALWLAPVLALLVAASSAAAAPRCFGAAARD